MSCLRRLTVNVAVHIDAETWLNVIMKRASTLYCHLQSLRNIAEISILFR